MRSLSVENERIHQKIWGNDEMCLGEKSEIFPAKSAWGVSLMRRQIVNERERRLENFLRSEKKSREREGATG